VTTIAGRTSPAPGLNPRPRTAPRNPQQREQWLDRFADQLDGPMTALGVVFVLLVLATYVTQPAGNLAVAFEVVAWVIWAVFVAEFGLRVHLAPDRGRYFRRNWWQIVFLLLPFLRFLRVVSRLRVGRLGRVASSAVRGTRTAGRLLGSRLAWLSVTTVIVVLASSQILYEIDAFPTYGDAVHRAALATISGQPLGVEGGFARVIDVVLSVYAVVVVAGLAATLGAYFVESQGERREVASRALGRASRNRMAYPGQMRPRIGSPSSQASSASS
jgi:voltage-gated potassium channel